MLEIISPRGESSLLYRVLLQEFAEIRMLLEKRRIRRQCRIGVQALRDTRMAAQEISQGSMLGSDAEAPETLAAGTAPDAAKDRTALADRAEFEMRRHRNAKIIATVGSASSST
jgi:hypothetical protein